ncbi:Acetaldehyde dehydrogenase (Acetylating) [Operophtera brumata]|uniref:Acetaldehyde dehydrogenase (Acetylating) n=1 Tax=Operophtera brumata TaxID=104452 RepID=A0A0L7KZM9_OPEBR|nr:Acetaldehyde dehydrogenase (Acetylating) [Operophtera brumata]
MSYSALSNEDIEFLKAKPNISKLVDSQQKLHTSVKETMALVRRAYELDKVFLDFCEEQVNRIIEHIMENSTVE